jgi:excinuclease UvrABC nuclease subunit
MKTCSKCYIEKPLNEYYVDKSKLSGYCSQCKSCHQYYKKLGHKQHKGVYGIFSTNECLYVGESEELRNRIWAHNSNLKNITTNIEAQRQLYINITKHNNIIIKILEECDNHKERELHWINKLKPKYNNIGVCIQ